MRRNSIAGALALCLAVAGCNDNGGSGEAAATLGAADQAKAQAMLEDYQSARQQGNPEVAEATADKLREKYPDSAAAQQLEATLADVRKAAEAVRDTRRLQKLWDYQANTVGKGTQRSATIFSRVPDLGDEAPAATPDAQLVLRDHPDWGRSVYLLLADAKFACGKPCRLQLAFDGAPLDEWAGKQADSGKGPALFIEDEPRFIKALAGAKTLKIVLPKGSGHLGTLNFEVGGFDSARYAKP
jgi:hypothetical protein